MNVISKGSSFLNFNDFRLSIINFQKVDKYINQEIQMISKYKKRDKQKLHSAHEKFSKKAKHAKANARAKAEAQTYVDVIENFTKSDYTLFIFDVRNPFSCRCQVLEQFCENKIFVLNKIDLVPREVVIGWLKSLSEIAPTVAISAINSVDSLAALLSPTISQKPNIFITGTENIGKSTIKEALLQHPDLHDYIKIGPPIDWPFLVQTPDLELINSVPVSYFHSLESFGDLLFRISVMSTCEVFQTTFPTDQISCCNFINDDPGKASQEIMKRLSNGEIKYYTVPPSKSIDNNLNWISEIQKNDLKFSQPFETISEKFLLLSRGTMNTIKIEALNCLKKMFPKKEKQSN